jgi:predicted Zn-dependent peptidase
MIQHLIFPSLEDRVARVGGRAQMQRTADAIVYTVTGPSSELPYLSQLLISTLQVPQAPQDVLLRVDRILREERLAEWETAAAHARSVLRNQLFPTDISAAGTDRSATRFTSGALPSLWANIYRPERVSIVAVGDVYLGDVQRQFAELPRPPAAPALLIERDSVVAGALAPAQATRAWLAAGYLANDLNPAAVTITARLLGDLIRTRVPSAQVEAEHWWTHHGMAVVLVVAVPERDMASARRVMGTAVSTLRQEVSFLRAVEASHAVRRELLFFSRTPDRMAEVIGQFVDREGDPDAAERFYADLADLDDRDVREVLDRLIDLTPARVEIPPQALQPRR